jgi:hypothetical protein
MVDDLIANSQGLMKMIFSMWNLLLIVLVWSALHVTQERFSEFFEKPKVGWRLLPFMPSIVTTVLCFLDGPWFPSDVHPTTSMRIVFGLGLGFVSYNFGGMVNRAGAAGLLNKLGVDWIVEKTTPTPKEVSPPPIPEETDPEKTPVVIPPSGG